MSQTFQPLRTICVVIFCYFWMRKNSSLGLNCCGTLFEEVGSKYFRLESSFSSASMNVKLQQCLVQKWRAQITATNAPRIFWNAFFFCAALSMEHYPYFSEKKKLTKTGSIFFVEWTTHSNRLKHNFQRTLHFDHCPQMNNGSCAERCHLTTELNTALTDHINTRGQGSLTCDLQLRTFTDPWPYYIALDYCDVGVHDCISWGIHWCLSSWSKNIQTTQITTFTSNNWLRWSLANFNRCTVQQALTISFLYLSSEKN